MFEKRAEFTGFIDIQPLNAPQFSKDTFYVDQHLDVQPLIITASIESDGNNEAPIKTFDLETEIKSHPDSLFVKCFAIKADEMNDNGDYFSQKELIKATSTFVGVPVFTNHQNQDVEKSRGKVVHSWWDGDKNGIMIIARVDAHAYPQLARGIKEKYIVGTSMGASRGHDLVSMANGSKKRVDELQIGDDVYTHSGHIEKVTAVCETQEHSKLYHIKWSGNKNGLALSYEHPVLVLDREDVYHVSKIGNKYRHSIDTINRDIKTKFVPASELKSDDYVLELIDHVEHAEKPKFDSFFYKNYIAHRIKEVTIIDNNEPTYYVQIGQLDDKDSDHSYILNDIASHNCQVSHSLCSVCHNYAETPDSYCSCIRERKTRDITAKNQKCQYHKNGDEDECPLCASTKKEAKKYSYSGKAFEYNFGIKFIENSFVCSPACDTCGVEEIIDPSVFLAKVSRIQKALPGLLKAAAEMPLTCTDQSCIKIAGQQEINDLQEAINKVTSVSQSMLQQKDQLDLEFLSDLVKVLADLQGVTDELVQQGYGKLQSPGAPPPPGPQGQPDATNTIQTPGEMPTGNITTGPAGGAGTVTGPAASKQISLEKLSHNMFDKLFEIMETKLEKKSIEIDLDFGKNKSIDLDFKIDTQFK